MDTMRSLVASLGTPGAIRNAALAIRHREAEDRAIEDLTRALAETTPGYRASAAA
jgi:hypothetical protein